MSEPDTLPDPGEVPVLDWISKELIDVDHAYQRPEDQARAEKIARSFSWSKFGAIVVVPKPDGRYAILDGQHRAAAAKMHPMVDHLPAVLMPSVHGVTAEANSFIGLNAERKAVSGLELFHAKLAAGDEDAVTLDQVAQRAGVTVPRYPGSNNPGETIAVNAIQALIGRRGAMRARQFLEILAKAELAPITANQIKAVEHLMSDPEFAGQVDGEDLTRVVVEMGPAAEHEAKRFAATHCVPLWKGLASTWFQKCRKRRAPVQKPIDGAPAAPSKERAKPKGVPTPLTSMLRSEIAERAAAVARRPQSVTGSVMGDPAPGRSALDQRRAG